MAKSRKNGFVVVLVTVPDLKTGRALAKAILEGRHAACVNIVPGIESHYWWQGKIQHGKEVLLLIKTTSQRLGELQQCVLANHPYDTPEFVVLPIDGGNKRYLEWISDSVKNATVSATAKVTRAVHKAAQQRRTPKPGGIREGL
jgi:periplasmic divalent cation tolerance protein